MIGKVMSEKDAFNYIEPLLRFMEDNPELDYGQPGPIVHFMEGFDGYEKLLVESIKRMPISHTIDEQAAEEKRYLRRVEGGNRGFCQFSGRLGRVGRG